MSENFCLFLQQFCGSIISFSSLAFTSQISLFLSLTERKRASTYQFCQKSRLRLPSIDNIIHSTAFSLARCPTAFLVSDWWNFGGKCGSRNFFDVIWRETPKALNPRNGIGEYTDLWLCECL